MGSKYRKDKPIINNSFGLYSNILILTIEGKHGMLSSTAISFYAVIVSNLIAHNIAKFSVP